MATTVEFIEFVCDQIRRTGAVRYRKMFGEYMVYVNDKPILLVCSNTVYVKMLDCVSGLMADAEKGVPYQGGTEHYILDVEDAELAAQVIGALEPVTPFPRPRKSRRREQL